ncbi:MAG: hypothetical protein FWF90_11470 [Promicromonosporaceae bacterium]|nr:hypothetical protein [Promicromonosporaceae bacterium]
MAEQITTAAELDALPVGSVVRTERDGGRFTTVWEKATAHVWYGTGEGSIDGRDLARRAAGGKVLYIPSRDLLAEAEARGAREALTGHVCGDEHHTLDELYEYRMLYNAHAAHGWLAAGIPVFKSFRHHDGEPCFGGGWFIVTAQLPTGQVSNHYPAEAWPLFHVPVVTRAPAWDGHTPQDAAERLREALSR